MNEQDTMQILRDEIKDMNYWLEPKQTSPVTISSMMDRIRGAAARINLYVTRLKELEWERLADLRENGPKVVYDDEIVITLLRDGVEKHINFGRLWVDVRCTSDEHIIQQLKINQDPPEDGFTYYIYAIPGAHGIPPIGVQISKKEAAIIKERLTALNL